MPNPDPQSPLRVVHLDPGSVSEEGSGYRVRLTGPVDAKWTRAYLSVWAGLSFFSKFHLDVGTKTVWFELPKTEARTEIASLLEVLEALLRLTSQRAEAIVPEVSAETPAPRRNRLGPASRSQAHAAPPLPPALPNRPPPPPSAEPVEDLTEDDIDSLVIEDLIGS